MKSSFCLLLLTTIFLSCNVKVSKPDPDDTVASDSSTVAIVGTWKLVNGTIIEKGDTLVTEYSGDRSFIKIINDTHFAFMQHDLNKGKDSGAVYSSGGGTYKLVNNNYTEHLEYCSARNWEGHDFSFTIQIQNDTLIQSGIEKIESEGIDRLNIEKYVRLKK